MQEQNEIEGLYRKYYGDVYRYLLSLCRNCHAAEDLSQNTFLKVISGIRQRGCSGTMREQGTGGGYFQLYRFTGRTAPFPADTAACQ